MAFTTAEGRLRIWRQNPLCHALQEIQDVPTALYPADLALGDLNADGRTDIVVVGAFEHGFSYPGEVRIHLQSIGGFVTPPIPYTVGTNPQRIVIDDVTSDGRPDLVVSSKNNLDILVQQPHGSFSGSVVDEPNFTEISWLGAYEIAIADLNHDGLNDIALQGHSADPNVVVYQQRPDGSGFATGAFLQSLTGPMGGGASGMTAGDITGDGRADIIVTLSFNMPFAQIAIYEQRVTGDFGAPVYYAAYDNPIDPTIADMNSDGRNDVVVLNSGYGSYSVYYQQPDGSLAAALQLPAGELQATFARASDLGDATGDGALDVVHLSHNYGLTLVTNGSLPTCAVTPPSPARAPSFSLSLLNVPGLSEMVTGDVDADGQLEFLTLSNSSAAGQGVKVIKHRPDGSLGFGGTIPVQSAFSTSTPLLSGLAAGDLNGDGLTDVAVADTTMHWFGEPGEVAVALQGHCGAFLPAKRYDLPSQTLWTMIADWTGDGANDLSVITDSGWYVLAQQSDGTLAAAVQLLPDLLPSAFWARPADWNRDGRMDLVAYWHDYNYTESLAGPLRVFLQEAGGAYRMLPPVMVWPPNDLQVGDVNSDGRPDIVLTYGENPPTGGLRIVPQNPDGSLGNRVLLSAPEYQMPGGLAIADLNGDRRTDLLVLNSWSYLSVFTQNSTHTFDPVLRYNWFTLNRYGPYQVAQIDADQNGIPEVVGVASPDDYLFFLKPQGNAMDEKRLEALLEQAP